MIGCNGLQRLFDLLFSALALICFSPLFIIVAFVLRMTGEGEVLYKQDRVGLGQRRFRLLKFATMLKDSPDMLTGTLTIKNDPRILPVGLFLRKTKINELPQLLNVFFGDMSLVGPRPLTKNTFDLYSSKARLVIASVKPGLSGIGSICFRDEEKLLDDIKDPEKFYAEVIAPYKQCLEEWYCNNRSITIYFAIIFLTAFVVIFPSVKVIRIFPNLPKPPSKLSGLLR